MKTKEPIRDLYNQHQAALAILVELSRDFTTAGQTAYLAQVRICKAIRDQIFFAEQGQMTNKW
jgi:hypothetical protein